MDSKRAFLKDFKTYLIGLQNVQIGNFIEALENQIHHPTEDFFNLLCRKIDIKRNIFVDYDDKQDLKSLSQEILDNNGWLKCVYILTYFFLTSQFNTIKYKALNTLLKSQDCMSKDCLENSFVQTIYKQFIKEAL